MATEETNSPNGQTNTAVDERTEIASPWVTVVWDDPVNLMSYVTYVFQTYFGYSEGQADQRMREVHERGRAVVSAGSKEKCERDTQAMHTYGLWATFERSEGFE